VSNYLITAGLFVAGLAFTAWQIRRGEHADRNRRDRAMAHRYTRFNPTPERQQPGTDPALLLDCIAVYGDCDELNRLRNTLNQHRKEKP